MGAMGAIGAMGAMGTMGPMGAEGADGTDVAAIYILLCCYWLEHHGNRLYGFMELWSIMLDG